MNYNTTLENYLKDNINILHLNIEICQHFKWGSKYQSDLYYLSASMNIVSSVVTFSQPDKSSMN